MNPTTFQSLIGWYSTKESERLIKEQQRIIETNLTKVRGVIAIECSHYRQSITSNRLRVRHNTKVVNDPSANSTSNHVGIYAKWNELPFEANSVDIIILHHVLEFDDNPTQILREAAILLKPHGDLIITSFNRWSLFNLKQRFNSKRHSKENIPKFNLISRYRLSNWLEVIDCKILKHQRNLYIGYGKVGNKINPLLSKLNCIGHAYSVTHARKFTMEPTTMLRHSDNLLKRMLQLKPSYAKAIKNSYRDS